MGTKNINYSTNFNFSFQLQLLVLGFTSIVGAIVEHLETRIENVVAQSRSWRGRSSSLTRSVWGSTTPLGTMLSVVTDVVPSMDSEVLDLLCCTIHYGFFNFLRQKQCFGIVMQYFGTVLSKSTSFQQQQKKNTTAYAKKLSL